MTENINLTAALKKYFGFDTFKGDQERIIRNVLAGKDTFVLMPTGGGKSLCYQLPSLLMEGTAIVISPLIALMKNQVDFITQLSEHEGTAHYLNSSLNKAATDLVKTDIREGRTKLLYVAPESLTKEENVEFLNQRKSGSLACYSATWTADYNDPDTFFYTFFGDEENTRFRSLNYPREDIMEQVRQARTISDPEERIRKYYDLERIIAQEDAAWIPLFSRQYLYVASGRLKGMQASWNGSVKNEYRKMSVTE